jgi:hypothetical protein
LDGGTLKHFTSAHTFNVVYRDAYGTWWFDGQRFSFWETSDAGPEPYVDPLSLLLQYLYTGDFFGFFIGLFAFAFGDIALFYSFLAFVVGTVMYIRFKSILICFLFWIMCGSAIAALIPQGAIFGVLLGVIAVGTLLFKLFMTRRNEYT